jgi:hypothetical protein
VIGLVVEDKRDGGDYRIVGAFEAGYVLDRIDTFASPRHVTFAELHAGFGVEADEPAGADEARGWQALAEANDRNARRQALAADPEAFEPEPGTPAHDAWRRAVQAATTDPRPSPEDQLQRISAGDAARIQPKPRARKTK